ncbi:hypothetical protein [Paraburkholderia humisilvae]|uniref:hypothetical protein n=1 Tax=Paraburkholderia humisilvae TaxID=627669 RepID=UPI001FE30253|nr:hypothetical protein [Paraburkholderia humisilvae]
MFVRISTKRNLERLASHYGNTITNTVENLINEKTVSILNGLSETEQHEFYNEEPVHKRQNAK